MAKRYIIIDDDTIVGYNYLKKKFFVTNKETTTYRNTAEQIVAVLKALDITQYSASDIENEIYKEYETLDKVYCTLEDTGAYIRTIQFNDWVGYPLEVDCEQRNIFIKNSNISYSLELNESFKSRVQRFCSFYLETLGLSIEEELMKEVYDLLIKQYNVPSFYNVLSSEFSAGTYSYGGDFDMNNFNDSSAITCSGVSNPEGNYSSQFLVNVENINTSDYLINFETPVSPEDSEDLRVGSKVILQGAEIEVEGAVYNADGEYTISQLINSSLGNRNWCGVALKGDKLFILSSDGYVSSSDDNGTTWSIPEQIDELQGKEWVGLAYGNGKFIALGRFGYMATSVNGSGWSVELVETLSNQEWTNLIYSASTERFVAIGYYGFISVYEDDWTQPARMWDEETYMNLPNNQAKEWCSITCYNNKFLAMNRFGYYCTTTGISGLESFELPNSTINRGSKTWADVAFGGDQLVAISSDGYTGRGSLLGNKIIWDSYQSDNLGDNNWSSIICLSPSNSKFLALSYSGYLSTNENNKWSQATIKSDNNFVAIQVNEPASFDYEYPYPSCYAQAASGNVLSLESEGNVIKIEPEQFPKNLVVGNAIHIENALAEQGDEIISCDGTYTISDISNQVKDITDVVIGMKSIDSQNIITIESQSTELIEGDVIEVKGTGTSNDKKYTISEIILPEESEGDSYPYVVLSVNENIPFSYQPVNMQTGLSVAYTATAATNIITLPPDCLIAVKESDVLGVQESGTTTYYTVSKVINYTDGKRGLTVDKSLVSGDKNNVTIIVTSTEDVTLNCQRTIYYNVYVEENIPTDFVSDSDHQATFYKETFVGNIINISSTANNESLITFDEISKSIKLSQGSVLYIYILGQKYISKVSATFTENNQMRIGSFSESIPYISQMPPRASIYLKAPRKDIRLTLTDEHDSLVNEIPLGNFTVDNFNQCCSYIKTMHDLDASISKKSNIPDLQDSIRETMYKQLSKGDTLRVIEIGEDESVDIIFKGLYGEIYIS